MYTELKKECFESNMLLPKLDLVIYTFGNVSCIDRERSVFAIKPSGIDYDLMSYNDIVIVGLDGKIVDGKLRPSSDTNTHCVLYKAFGNIGGIVHTHSPFATAWAQSLRSIPIYGTTHADHLATDIPCTELMADTGIVNDYETETGNQIVDCFANKSLNPDEVQMVLVAGHGPFAWGKNAGKAVYNAKILEELARMALLTEQINPSAMRLKESLVAKHYERKHGKNAYYGQN
jgi:L-ribulose-5-phosphate 4-epimerase